MKTKYVFLMGCLLLSSGYHPVKEKQIVQGQVTDGERGLQGVQIQQKGTAERTVSGVDGTFSIAVTRHDAVLVFTRLGFETKEVAVQGRSQLHVILKPNPKTRQYVVVDIETSPREHVALVGAPQVVGRAFPAYQTEDYSPINESGFQDVTTRPLSTFSIDVDGAAYSNVRRFLENGNLPPVDAVRIEEMINYFDYDYPKPESDVPLRIVSEISRAPWNPSHRLVHIGLQGKEVPTAELPPSNLVFLIDVSGSMQMPNKLPLLKRGFKLLVNQLRAQDRVAIVTYASHSGVALEATSGDQKAVITEAIESLRAGGSTAGAAGIQEAYRIARAHFVKGGNNRVILATDGDFNVGPSSDGELQRLIERERESGIFLSVLGFGMGNYKDNKLELLANKGNGNYAYIDNFSEARKVLASEFGNTLFTIAKDVKLQVEFNPAYVQSYRLIGYENRLLNDSDFEDDKKDAGELGTGHTVTALYELVPGGSAAPAGTKLKYQNSKLTGAANSQEVLNIKLRYKDPDGSASKEIEAVLVDTNTPLDAASENFRFAASVAGFGMLLRHSEFSGEANYDELIRLARDSKGEDLEGYRAEFLGLLKTAQLLSNAVGMNKK